MFFPVKKQALTFYIVLVIFSLKIIDQFFSYYKKLAGKKGKKSYGNI
jgi:hypothetical protein